MNDSIEKDPNENPFDDGSEPAVGADAPVGEVSKDDCTWGTLTHLSGLLATFVGGGVFGFVGPLIIWMVKREESAFVDDQGKEATNFHITMVIAYVIAGLITGVTCGLGFPLLFVPALLQVIFSIIAALKTNDGNYYRYPMTFRIIK